jgi:hypothetical protein
VDQVKKFTTNELIMLGGCVAVFIGTFLPWIGAEACFGNICAGGSVSGFHYFFQGTIPWLLAIALAAVLIIRKLVPTVKLPDNVGGLEWNLVYLIAGGVAGVLILLRMITGDSGLDRKIGLFLATIGGIAMAVGAFLKYQAKEEDAPAGGSTPPTPF